MFTFLVSRSGCYISVKCVWSSVHPISKIKQNCEFYVSTSWSSLCKMWMHFVHSLIAQAKLYTLARLQKLDSIRNAETSICVHLVSKWKSLAVLARVIDAISGTANEATIFSRLELFPYHFWTIFLCFNDLHAKKKRRKKQNILRQVSFPAHSQKPICNNLSRFIARVLRALILYLFMFIHLLAKMMITERCWQKPGRWCWTTWKTTTMMMMMMFLNVRA